MSPLWHSRLVVLIAPGQISLFKLGRGMQPRLLASHEEAIESSMLSPPWGGLAEKLAELLSAPEWRAPEADIVLSNRLVKHAVVPFNDQLKKYSEQEGFARHVLTKTYGSAAAQWELRLHHQGGGGPTLVGAVERALLESLGQACAAHQVKVRSVTSRFMHVFNHHRKLFQPAPSWLAVSEPSHTLLALVSGGKIISVSGAGSDALADLPVLLDRENLASDLPHACKAVYLDAPEGALPADSGYDITRFDALLPHDWLSPIAEQVPALLRDKKGAGRIRLNFQQPTEQPNRRAGWMLLAAGIFLVLEMGISYDRLHRDRAAMEQEIRASRLRLDDPGASKASVHFEEKDFDAGRQIMNRLATPWDAFFNGLESISNKNAAILSIAPDVQTGVLRIAGEARDYASALTLVAQLRTTKPFSDVYLASHEIKRDDPQHPVGFVISMHWANRS